MFLIHSLKKFLSQFITFFILNSYSLYNSSILKFSRPLINSISSGNVPPTIFYNFVIISFSLILFNSSNYFKSKIKFKTSFIDKDVKMKLWLNSIFLLLINKHKPSKYLINAIFIRSTKT